MSWCSGNPKWRGLGPCLGLLHPADPSVPQLLSRTSIANTRQDKTANTRLVKNSKQESRTLRKKMFPILSIVLMLSISQSSSKPVFDLIPEGGHATSLAGQGEVSRLPGDVCTCTNEVEGQEECKLDSELVCRREVAKVDESRRPRARRHKNRRRRLREQLRRILQGRE